MSKIETRIQILDTAVDLFWKAGFNATNMNDLSFEAGVNKATVYQHFRSKDDLASAAVERAVERTVEYVFDGAFAAKSAPLDRLREIYQRIYQTHQQVYDETATSRGCPFVNIGMELASTNDEIREAVRAAFETFASYYLQIVMDLKKQGLLTNKQRPQQLAKDLQDNMNASMITSKIENRPQAILEGEERAVRYLTGAS